MKQLLVYVQCVGSNGVLAQLGARNIRNVEATGSNPVYSIQTKQRRIVDFFRKPTILRHFLILILS